MPDTLYDLMNAGQVNPQMALSNMVAPNAMSMLRGEPDPRSFPNNPKPGKIPYMEDPRVGGSILEALMLAGSAAPVGRAAMGAGAAGRIVPEFMQAVPGLPGMSAAGAPAVAGGATLASILGGGSSMGADFGEPQPQRPSDVQKQIDNLSKAIDPIQKRVDRLKANFEGGRIDKSEYNRQRVPLESQLERSKGQITEIDAPYQRDLKAWETRKNDFLTTQSTNENELANKRANAELPFRVKYPEATSAIVGGGNALTGATAAVTGLLSRGKIKPTLGAMGVGAVEGAATANIPELLDLGGMQPKGGPGWQKTYEEFTKPDNLIKTGAESAVHAAGAGGISYGLSLLPKVGARIGEYGKNVRDYVRSPGPEPQPGSSPPAPSTGATGPSSTASKPPGSYQSYTTQSGDKVVQTPHGWQGVHPDTGKWGFVKKPDGPLEKLMKGE